MKSKPTKTKREPWRKSSATAEPTPRRQTPGSHTPTRRDQSIRRKAK